MKYYYGMKARGFSPLCQPMQNFVKVFEDQTGEFWNILVYSEPLTEKEMNDFELEFITAD